MASSIPDFSCLPPHIRTKIVWELDLKNRLNLAMTCKAFVDSLLNSDGVGCEMRLLATPRKLDKHHKDQGTRIGLNHRIRKGDKLEVAPMVSNWSWANSCVRPGQNLRLTLTQMVTHLCVSVDGNTEFLQEMAPDFCFWIQYFVENNRRLDVLTLRPCNLWVPSKTKTNYDKEFLQSLCQLIANNASSLRELHFYTWVLDPEAECPSIHDLVMTNPGLHKGLRCFSLLWAGNDVRDWQPLNGLMPEKSDNLAVICTLTRLQELNIPSQFLDSDLLNAISTSTSRSRLKVLRVCFTNIANKIPDDCWRNFTSYHEGCKVEFTLMNDRLRSSCPSWRNAFTTSVPLTKVTFMKHSICEDAELVALSWLHSSSLESVLIQSLNSTVSSAALVDFVAKTKNLKNFVYFGLIHVETLFRIAETYGKRWGFIGFVDNQINMADPKSEDQEEFFFERRKMMLEAEHNQETLLAEICLKMSTILGQDWAPIPLPVADWNVEHMRTVQVSDAEMIERQRKERGRREISGRSL